MQKPLQELGEKSHLETEQTLISFSGRSMLPMLHDGDRILVDYCSPTKDLNLFEVGEILLLKTEEQWVVHRLVERNRTKGDRSLFFDTDESFVWGRVIGLQSANTKLVWGRSGLPFKKAIAWLSRNSATRFRLIRWPSLIALAGVVKISLLVSKSKK